jgi:hypothetical protein
VAFAKDLESSVSVRDESFINPNFRSGNSNNFSFFGASVENVDLKKENQLMINANGDFSPDVPFLSYLNIKELYLTTWGGLSFGRKLYHWSDLDERWHLGFYQPQFRWNPLLPQSQGLTGIFLDLPAEGITTFPLGLQLFGSFLFVPDQGAGYQLQNGQFSSQNPFFSQLPTQVQILTGDRVTTTNQTAYNLHLPDQSQVVFNSSFAAQVYAGERDHGLYFQSAFAYKPANSLAVAANTASTANNTTNIDLYPEVFDQTLVSADLHLSLKNFRFGFGAMTETPSSFLSSNNIPSNVTYRQFQARSLWSPYIEWHDSGLSAMLSYLDVQSTQDPAAGAQAQYLGTFLPQQMNFLSAAKAEAGYDGAFGRSRGWGLKFSYLQGTEQDFSMATTEAFWKISRLWTLNAFSNLIENTPSTTDPTIFQNYINNNEVGLGVRYVL